MFPSCFPRARPVAAALLALCAATPGLAAPDDAPLGLAATARLALERHPLLSGLDAQGRAARERAIAARALPDPQLSFGLSQMPIDGPHAGSLRGDADTQFEVALNQALPRAAKRALQGERVEREAQVLDAQRALLARDIARDAALAWVELWRYAREHALAQADAEAAHHQAEALRIALESNSASQAAWLAARVAAGRADDAVRAAEQGMAHARSQLLRWIGDAAFGALPARGPVLAPLPALDRVLARAQAHPQLELARARANAAQTGADLAQAAYRPDWHVALGYGHRPEFPELVSLQLGVDLPVDRRNRQDREVAAALAQQEAARAELGDVQRQLASEARLNHHDAERLDARLAAFDTDLLPQAAARIDAARAAFGAHRGGLQDVLEARRSALDLERARLALELDRLRHAVALEWLGAYERAAFTDTTEQMP